VLSSIINNYRQLKYKDKNLKHIIEYYDILEKNMKSETFHYSMLEENDITLKISTKVELSNAIGMFRNNGMKVFNKKGIRSFNNYSGILLLEGEAVNKYFRKLENPEHDSWEAERSNNYTEAKRRIQKIYLFIKNALTELENKGLLASENMEGIPSLPDEEPEEEGNEPSEGIELEPLKVRVPSKQTRIKRRVKVFGPGGGPIKGPGPISKPGGGKGSSGPGDGKKTTIQVFPNKLKIFHDNQGNYNLIFSLPEEAKDSECRVSISGEEFTEKIEIKEATQIKENKRISLKVYENKISIGNIDKEVTNKIQFKIEDDENWAMEVIFHDNQ
ncbi:MAG: hypothetical protein KKF65_00800, partial [Nanoarchaeota archaeon]|nr:hypothetical protein [Nanoarchaeota archaeon]